MSTFLVPLDDLETAGASIALGRQMATSFGAALGLVLANGSRKVDHGLHAEDGTAASTYILSVEPDEALLSWVVELEQPVIVLETPARSAGGELLSAWIARHSGSSVTTLAGKLQAGNPVHRLLVPLDGSNGAEEILSLASTVARKTGATIGLVRVIADALPGEDTETSHARVQAERHEARSYLDSIARELRRQDIQVTWEVRIGPPGDEIARAAETTAADLILMASTHYGTEPLPATVSVTGITVSAASVPIIVARISKP